MVQLSDLLIGTAPSTQSTVSSATATVSSVMSTNPVSTAPPATTTTAETSAGDSSASSSVFPSSTSAISLPSGLPNASTICTEDDAHKSGMFPICVPLNGTNQQVGDTVYFTWYTGSFDAGTQVQLLVNLANTSTNKWHSDWINANVGYALITFNDTLVNAVIDVLLTATPSNGAPATYAGPTITVIPIPGPAPPAHTSYNLLGLVIGLPVGLAVVAAVLCCLFCVVRKNKSAFDGLKVLRRRRGYGVGKSRRQRMGEEADYDFDASDPIYRDDPGAGFHSDYQDTSREERSQRAAGLFSRDGKLTSTL
jgi:hypothetical protein